MPTRLPKALGAPSVYGLHPVKDRISHLYLDTVRIVTDRNGVCAQTQHPDTGHIDRVYLPSASLACLLLGPGTSITQAAVTALTRDGAVLVWVGNAGVRCYSAFLHDSTSTELLHRQVRIVADNAAREAAARRHFRLRFGEAPPPDSTLHQLRGMEGARVKATYKLLARQHGVGPFKRSYDPHDFDAADPVNKALTAGNAALYGITTAVLLSLGASPALGLIHEHNQRAFTYDIADLYKTEYILPTAFSLARSGNPDRDIRYRLRDDLRLLRLVPRMIRDIHYILGEHDLPKDEVPTGVVDLWDPDGNVPAGVNYSALDEDPGF
ncbi:MULTISPECIES: type I-E CRISPR-associated endonuclease Cas1e [unclassified Saccharopolyspora]|uniref:type I-E CRISPR-associated endonuclease Cas1e n=1 Tax=unclassified Saccharopolyspora TaxID=2646250 RepID=UPI001CD7F0A5|nr:MULTISPECIES: type I-E CRISPR-associated endonuclease Cas1e [unclassified Saccharopolyspora]MCA1188777.1 type I-E CRISPR-associated endonuclease Cas1e [Saccharopolyspora sp. 6T]MCA1283269.1 type I-E CRISPR-associated endonuclease Cas1e [Saccharopolyspora sp. 7B]